MDRADIGSLAGPLLHLAASVLPLGITRTSAIAHPGRSLKVRFATPGIENLDSTHFQ
jgi:hypothetical protein